MNLIKKILKKKWLVALILIIALGGGYYGYQKITAKTTTTSYVTTNVSKGMLIVSVSGSGQVSASNQVDLKPKASGDILKVNVKAGQSVKAGDLIVSLNAKDALKTVRDATISLQSAKLSLQKLQQPADNLSLIQSENSLASAQQAKSRAEEDLVKAYEDAFTAVANAFLELPTVVTGVHDILYRYDYDQYLTNIDYYSDQIKTLNNTDYNSTATLFKSSAGTSYQTAKTAYDNNFDDYKAASRYDNEEKIEALLNETYNTTKLITEAVKNSDNYLSFTRDKLTDKNHTLPSLLSTHQSSISTYTSKANTNLSSLANIINTIKEDKETITSSLATIKEKTESLNDLKAGTDAIDLESAKLSVKQKENSLYDAQVTLADYSLRAPFDGIIASVDAEKGDAASSGTAVATLITQQKMAEVTLNEVDVAKVKVGQKATLTFDAVSDLSISGTVAEVDTIGTVSQNVVSYTVKIGFDTQDDQIKPGMSASASIITESKSDVLLVPNNAVKKNGTISYVEIFNPAIESSTNNQGIASLIPPTQQTVEVGLANDEFTEIISGLNEGDQVVTKTVTSSASATKSQTSIFSLFGMGGNKNSSATKSTGSSKSTNTNSSSSKSTSATGDSAGGPPDMGAGGPPAF
ncbi:MAG: efflux RND transporter periplasmic adaptor subunit [Candidatus Buchananbacteria bacterium]